MNYASLTTAEQGIRHEQIRKGFGEVDMGHLLQISTLVKTAYLSYCYMLSPLSLPCLPNDEVVFTMMSSASVCKIANLHFYVIFFSSIMSKTTANKITLVEAE